MRCNQCGRLLAKGEKNSLEIKCPRCKKINHFNGHEPHHTERQRSSLQGDNNAKINDQKSVVGLDGR
ncbi:MAG: Com family DNA-binding transcriptional regulator [Magnetococcales bacterium]|nr:Com family DNA-binding transcriptional regulator [Magnetococcales bacterium]